MAEDQDARCVAPILGTARSRNAIHHATGVLVFDGERFGQYVEGEASNIRVLLSNLLRDQRHANILILADLPIAKRAFERFRMGYTDMDDVEILKNLTLTASKDAMSRFLTLVKTCDVVE
ncbi:MAG: BLUF domain-containing protein [Propionivibrio sp.]|nr:BLUF domain-containing protein [Propionivibrio sp.]